MAPSDPQRASEGVRPGALTALLEKLVEAPESARGGGWGAALRPGATVGGRFELVRELGRGGFGVVWEARDRDLGRSVAIKAVRARGDGGVREERLLREAEAAARLSHPNIVTLHDLGASEHGPYLVLELLHGGTLEERLRDGAMPVREALRIVSEVTKGVAHAHERGVLHRDLKPANVFLRDDGQVKVLDLGLAHAFGQRRAEGGTRGYMAPEQLAGAPEDERTDVFALGVMLYEMLAGSLPFPDDRTLSSPQPAPALEVQGAPALGELVARMLSKDPLQRPRDAGELVRPLAAFERELQREPAPVGVRRRRPSRLRWIVAAVVLACLAAAALAYVRQRSRAPAPAAVASVAVLPFADMSPKHDQEYLADGVAEEILSALSHLEGVRVAGRTSSFYFKGRGEDLRTIGARLNVANVLEGSVRRSGDRIRVTAQLVGAADGYRVWSETFERDVRDIFAVQDEIARAVAARLRVELVPSAARARGAGTVDPDAHAELLRGRHLVRRGTEADHRKAIEAFERSIALDPGYAAAHAALSNALTSLHAFYDQGGDEVVVRARASAERAIALAPSLPDGYTVRAVLRWSYDYEWAGAYEDLEKALSLDPRHSHARVAHAAMVATLGRVEDAITELQGLLRDDPLFAGAAAMMGSYHNSMGRFDLAREVLRRALDVEPQHAHALGLLCFTEIFDGHPAEALALAQRIMHESLRRLVAAHAYHALGQEREGSEALAWLETGGRNAYNVAEVYAQRGDRDAAFAWLERARRSRDPAMRAIKYDRFLASIRSDPRYPEFLRKLNLPVD